MNERICVKCDSLLEPIKNGFSFVIGTTLRHSDLWGCRRCKRFQIHGCNRNTFEIVILPEETFIEADPGNDSYDAVLQPVMILSSEFDEHMREWYPHWEWKEEES